MNRKRRRKIASRNDIFLFSRRLADQGLGVDQDGAYGTQCVDLPNAIAVQLFGMVLWGNAIDLLDSAAANGCRVERNEVGNPDSRPRAGAVFVMDTTYIYGHPYGHTGIVIEDSDGVTMKTIEQNIDGNADSLYVGGPARYHERNFDGVVGWFYFPTDDEGYTPLPEPQISTGEIVMHEETGTFTVEVSALNVRIEPSVEAEIVAVYTAGMEINYDSWCDRDGYIWISYVGASGIRRFVAAGPSENGRRVADFGSFK